MAKAPFRTAAFLAVAEVPAKVYNLFISSMEVSMYIQMLEENKEQTKETILRHLRDFNKRHVPSQIFQQFREVVLAANDDTGLLVGGLLGRICFDWLEIDILALDEQVRGQGIGSRLLQAAEEEAMKNQCKFMKLDTFSFQAPDFYIKHGFEVFGQIEDVAGGYTHYYLIKKLRD
ncbi:GNAT family N-acetyltransferase [Paenibacillus larvae]|uniref:GNAT family N-acetyltransferase n=1 Tax=Paenibacillus larvae TaxID=1464 RepID=UPI0022802CAE|nr:GNAT family N-acetyltransferase [Paenibacillus larvae]MCY9510648.1 GNAT family N-acetyltransferase [Paenibacillus larvae]MCY9525676.1 GNAT family N-acetyltransferase [Paenibacillus larvae]